MHLRYYLAPIITRRKTKFYHQGISPIQYTVSPPSQYFPPSSDITRDDGSSTSDGPAAFNRLNRHRKFMPDVIRNMET